MVEVIEDSDFNELNGSMTNNQRVVTITKFEDNNDAIAISIKK